MFIRQLNLNYLLAILLLSMLSISPSFATTTVLGWSDEQAQTWARMKTENHPLFQRLENRAGGPTHSYQEIYDGLYYLVTSDASYAQFAYSHISDYKGKDNIGTRIPHRNTTRHSFGSMSMLYSWIADALPPTDKAHFKSILEFWANSIFYDNGTRAVDSDESTGHYMGLVMFATAIEQEDPALAASLLNFIPDIETNETRPVGGLDVTGDNRATMRNTIADYVRIAKGGAWLEGSGYNASTTRYLTEYAMAINQALGEDKFPEITAFIPDLIEAEIQMLTPSTSDLFQFGDLQNPHSPHVYHRLALISFLAHHAKDPRLNTLFDNYYAQLGSGGNAHFLIYANPYADRAPVMGQSHNAEGRGLAYHHSGWEENDSFFASAHFGLTGVDHEFENETNFGLYRNGEWIINNPRGFGLKAKATNTLLVSGGLFSAKEARGQTAYEAGDTYLYHVGVTGGQVRFDNAYNPPPESLHEWTRSYLYLHHNDNSDSVLIFDRLNNSNPITSGKVDRYADINKDEITLHDATTQLVFHLPNANLTESGDTRTWQTDNGQDVSLTSFLSSNYTTRVIDEKNEAANFLGPTIHEHQYKYQLRLISTQKTGFQTMMNIVHTGSDANITQYISSVGEQAEAVLIDSGSTSTLAVFNGDPGARPYSANGTAVAIEPSALNGNRAQHDPQRQAKNERLRYFKSGFNLTFTTVNNNSKVYLLDLNPHTQWRINLDGTDLEGLSPSLVGSLIFTIPSAGSHTLNVSSEAITCTTAGDMDNSGEIDIADVIMLINIILNSGPVSVCSDIHIDQQNTIQDVIALINLVLADSN